MGNTGASSWLPDMSGGELVETTLDVDHDGEDDLRSFDSDDEHDAEHTHDSGSDECGDDTGPCCSSSSSPASDELVWVECVEDGLEGVGNDKGEERSDTRRTTTVRCETAERRVDRLVSSGAGLRGVVRRRRDSAIACTEQHVRVLW
jgi:hypothetical protein